MKQIGLNRYKGLLAGLILLIFSVYYVNSTIFYHQHKIGNKTIFHSHFFSKKHTQSSENGGHTLAQIELISHLNSISIEEQNFDSHIGDKECILEYTIVTPSSEKLATFLGYSKSLRAPPVA